MTTQIPSEAEVLGYFDKLSNWAAGATMMN